MLIIIKIEPSIIGKTLIFQVNKIKFEFMSRKLLDSQEAPRSFMKNLIERAFPLGVKMGLIMKNGPNRNFLTYFYLVIS